ncbi:MAG: type II toxin-antitoxin system HicA family toxin [Patescibacteria group bacterium]
MKRRDLISHLEACDCVLLREGKRHSLYWNRSNQKTSTVPRHAEINHFLAKKICTDLDIKVWGKSK